MVKDPTVKVNSKQEPTRASGIFYYDALTNGEGRIFIDNEDKTGNFIDYATRSHPIAHGKAKGTSAAGGDFESATDFGALSTQSAVVAEETIDANDFKATLRALQTPSGLVEFGGEIGNTRLSFLGIGCLFEWDIQNMTVKRNCFPADELEIKNKFYSVPNIWLETAKNATTLTATMQMPGVHHKPLEFCSKGTANFGLPNIGDNIVTTPNFSSCPW